MILQRKILPQSLHTYKVVVIFLFTIFSSLAQSNPRSVQKLLEVQELLKGKPDGNSTLNSLLTNENDSVYLLDGAEKVYGSAPVVLYTDINNISLIATSNFPDQNIQLIRITVSNIKDLKNPISATIFKRFKNLKYVALLLDKDIQDSAVQNLVDFKNSEFLVFYQIINRS